MTSSGGQESPKGESCRHLDLLGCLVVSLLTVSGQWLVRVAEEKEREEEEGWVEGQLVELRGREEDGGKKTSRPAAESARRSSRLSVNNIIHDVGTDQWNLTLSSRKTSRKTSPRNSDKPS